MTWLITLVTGHRRLVLLAVAVLSAISLFGLTRLKFDDDPRNFFKTNDEQFRRLETLFADFGSDDNDCVLVVEAPRIFDPASIAALDKLVSQCRQIKGVDQVLSLFDARRDGPGRTMLPLVPKPGSPQDAYDRAEQRAMKNPLAAGQIISRNGQTTLVVVRLAGQNLGLEEIAPVVHELQHIKTAMTTSDWRVRLTGVPAIRYEIIRNVEDGMLRFNLVAAVLSTALAWLLFRRASAVVIVMAAPLFGSLWVIGLLELSGISINALTSIVPTLVLVIGLTDSVHFLVDIRHWRAEGLDRRAAAIAAVRQVGVASGLTSVTTAIGFLSLAVARADIIRTFGLSCAAGSVITFAAVITLVPLLASTRLGDWILLPNTTRSDWASRWSLAVVGWSLRNPIRVATVGLALTAFFTWQAFRLHPDSWLAENLPIGSESGAALAHCEEVFGGIGYVYGIVEWPDSHELGSPETLEVVREVETLFDEDTLAKNPLSILGLLSTLPEANRGPRQALKYLDRVPADVRRRFADEERRRTLVCARAPEVGSAILLPHFDALEDRLNEVARRHPGFQVSFTGSIVVANRNINRMISDLGSSVGLETVVICLLMTWAFRSLGLGIVSILPNLFPLVAVAAMIVSLGWPLQIGSVIVFNICLGLAVDDTIHVMTRFRRELARDGDVRSALLRSFAGVGPAILTTTAILLVGLGSVTISRVPALRLFGQLSCATLFAALVAELALLPALVLLFMRWRPPRVLMPVPMEGSEPPPPARHEVVRPGSIAGA
ncbi:MAG: MMPL family transporter [Pirellulales bacterium]|nr:MMPL family transporter [Pirellulales bacterium]